MVKQHVTVFQFPNGMTWTYDTVSGKAIGQWQGRTKSVMPRLREAERKGYLVIDEIRR